MKIKTAMKYTLLILCILLSCDQGVPPPIADDPDMINSDEQLWSFIAQHDPFPQYSLFPHADSVAVGTLNGSTAHRPSIRVSLNATAAASLNAGRFPVGGSFSDSSVVFKEAKNGSTTTLIAVVVKQRGNTRAAQGWLWAEFAPNGSVVYSIQNKGAGCIGCHSLEAGPQHDFIRTFERQTP